MTSRSERSVLMIVAAHETAGACAFVRKRSLFTELEPVLPALLAARGKS